jgi:type IV secretory pathway TrbF-like protein
MAPTSPPDHIEAGIALQDQQYGAAIIRARNWRYMALVVGVALLYSIYGQIRVGSLPKREPVYFEVDSCTNTIRALGPKPRDYVPGEAVIKKYLWVLTQTLRNVGDDKEDMRAAWARAFHGFTEDGKRVFVQYFQERKPFEASGVIKVELLGIYPRTATTYAIRWVEKVYDKQHAFQRQEQWGGEYTFVQRPPQTTDEDQSAPEGIFVQSFGFSKEP